MSSITTGQFALPKQHRVAPPGRTSQYHDQLDALVPGSTNAVVETNVDDVKKVTSRFSSAVAQYRKRSGSRARFTIRSFVDEASGKTFVGVWKLEGNIADRAPSTKSADAPVAGADANAGSTTDATGAEG